jgi:hypothetical protein
MFPFEENKGHGACGGVARLLKTIVVISCRANAKRATLGGAGRKHA